MTFSISQSIQGAELEIYCCSSFWPDTNSATWLIMWTRECRSDVLVQVQSLIKQSWLDSKMVVTSLASPSELYFIFPRLPFIFSLFLPLLCAKTQRAVIIHGNMCQEIIGEVTSSILINCLKLFSPPSLNLCKVATADRFIYLVISWVLTGKKEKAEGKKTRQEVSRSKSLRRLTF